ncbi:M15 family metallopeptidase [Microlunatus sp. Y2014]|uniref:M15 family metallopeptidase n=1 Tax=Microlunatus sp. Y2014 TaxID=3418488 RepID=UPI003DA75495
MKKAGMVRPECPVQDRSQLRRVDVPYVDFDGKTQLGHLVVHADTAASVARIFTALYEMDFPIRRMAGVEQYGGDVYKSLAADNTSAYNCRPADQINSPFTLSPHANGRAVDINPVENPFQDPHCRCWKPTGEHAERTKGPGKILKDDPVWQVFNREGWIWQNFRAEDYMHFDTGYPSRPLRPRGSA